MKQGKVSMVMPCYNKAADIGNMFDSILAQEWDNIELILVNDGSTDGTRKVIAEYEEKFIRRGFQIKIIDQENQGVIAAAKNGLKHITGDYVSLIDADDELSPEYCLAMAGWLDEHSEIDICICGGRQYLWNDRCKEWKSEWIDEPSDKPLLERWLLEDISPSVWVWMTRRSYLETCNIYPEAAGSRKGSHEPSYIIPILAGTDRVKFVDKMLYYFNITPDPKRHSFFDEFTKAKKHWEEYQRLADIMLDTIELQSISYGNLVLYHKHAELMKMLRLNYVAEGTGANLLLDKIEECLKKNYGIEFALPLKDLVGWLFYNLRSNLPQYLISGCTDLPMPRRVIGYGCLGKMAAKWIPYISRTLLSFEELWDIKGDGVKIKKPDFSSLKPGDMLIVFPYSEDILADVSSKIDGSQGMNIVPFGRFSEKERRNFILSYLTVRKGV